MENQVFIRQKRQKRESGGNCGDAKPPSYTRCIFHSSVGSSSGVCSLGCRHLYRRRLLVGNGSGLELFTIHSFLGGFWKEELVKIGLAFWPCAFLKGLHTGLSQGRLLFFHFYFLLFIIRCTWMGIMVGDLRYF